MSETKLPAYRRTYEDPRLDRSYRVFVDSQATIRGLAEVTGLPTRTATRYASRDQWVEEREERTRARLAIESRNASLAAQQAAAATDGDIAAKLAAGGSNPDLKTVTLAVLKRQQKLFDRIEEQAVRCFEAELAKSEETGKPIAIGRLFPIVNLAEKIATNVRRAYGVPDVSRVEWEDTTPAAKRHADTIRQRRAARLVASATKAEGEAPTLPN